MKVLVTGAGGFVGQALVARLSAAGHEVVAARRRAADAPVVAVGDIGPDTDWRAALAGVDTVVHLAARVHVMRDTDPDPETRFRAVNTEGTLTLARQAVAAGVRRFVYLSSIKVNGEGRAEPYVETDEPDPHDAYARSKLAAEQGLAALAAETGLEVVVLRPPLVYGPGVKANFRALLHTVERGWPLPLGAVRNRRSLLYLGNLVDAIRVCLDHPAAAGRTFLLDDGSPVSTPELIRAVAHAFGRPARLWPVPVAALRVAGALTGRGAAVARLAGSLAVDSRAIRATLDWTPPYSMTAGLAATVAAWREAARHAA